MHESLIPFYGSDSPFNPVDLVRQVGGQGGGDPVPFRGIVNERDEEGMQGNVIGAAFELLWPSESVTLTEGDHVAIVDAAGAVLRRFRVARDGRRFNDGRESTTYLSELE